MSDRSQGLSVWRVVVELQQLGALTVDALVTVGFHHNALLTRGRVAAPARRIDRSTFGVMDQEPNECPVELSEHR